MSKNKKLLISSYIPYFSMSTIIFVLLLMVNFRGDNTQNLEAEKEVLFVVNYMDKANLLMEQEKNFNFDNIVNIKSNFFDSDEKTYKYFYKNTIINQIRKGGYEDLYFSKYKNNLMLKSKNYNISFCKNLKKVLELKGNLYPFNLIMVKPIDSDPMGVYQYLIKANEKYNIYINNKPIMENKFTCSDYNEILVMQK
jgi:hypothetical protein